MGLHGKGLFGQSRASLGMPWLICRRCDTRTYLRDYRYQETWRKKRLCPACERELAAESLKEEKPEAEESAVFYEIWHVLEAGNSYRLRSCHSLEAAKQHIKYRAKSIQVGHLEIRDTDDKVIEKRFPAYIEERGI